jgi:hypothetical protein
MTLRCMGTHTSPVTVGPGASSPTIALRASVPGSFVLNTTTLAARAHPLAVVARTAGALTSTSPPVHLTVEATIDITRDYRVAAARDGSVRATQQLPDPPRG